MDRSYSEKTVLNQITDAGYDFVVALRRNSKAYDVIKTGDGHFIYGNRAINYGSGKFWDFYAYRFEDLSMKSDEIYYRYKS